MAMRRPFPSLPRLTGLLLAGALVAFGAFACEPRAVVEPAPPPPPPPPAQPTIALTATRDSIPASQTARLTAVVRDTNGVVIPKPKIAWRSTAPQILKVD